MPQYSYVQQVTIYMKAGYGDPSYKELDKLGMAPELEPEDFPTEEALIDLSMVSGMYYCKDDRQTYFYVGADNYSTPIPLDDLARRVDNAKKDRYQLVTT